MLLKSLTPARMVQLLMGIFFILMLSLSLRQHAGFKTQLNDLGNIAQPLWNTLNGRFMEMSNTPTLPFDRMNRFGGHTNFIYLFLVPLYAVWSDPRLLLIAQVFMATLAIWPLYLLGRQLHGRDSWMVLVGPLVYILNPMLHDAVLYDIHAIVIGLPFLLFCIYFLEIKNYKNFAISALFLVLCKEDMPLLLVMLGLWHSVRTRNWKLGLSISGVSFGIFILLILGVMPWFRQGVPEILVTQRYEHLGGGVDQIVKTAITKPYILVADILDKGGVRYLFLILLGFGFTPLLSSISIVAIPSLAINLLSSNPITSQPFGYYYLAPVIGVASAAVVYALSQVQKKSKWKISFKELSISVVVVALGFSYWFSPLPYSRVSSWGEFEVDSRLNDLSQIKSLIPGDASLSVQGNLGAHFINREDIIHFPYRAETSDFVLIDVTDPYPIIRDKPRQRNFVHISQMFPQYYYDSVLAVFGDENYGVLYIENNFILFQKGGNRETIEQDFQRFNTWAQTTFAPYQEVSPFISEPIL